MIPVRSSPLRRLTGVAVLGLVTVVASGCASTRAGGESAQSLGARLDPIEPVNRAIYRFNDVVDKNVLKPVAQGYKFILPTQVRYCISNAFGNIADVPTAINNFLQGKIRDGGSDLCRVGVNTTVGLFGCFDVASKWGFEKHNEDFGQTLGRWGVPTGPYLVIPLLGPSSLRDATALLAVDTQLDPLGFVNDIPVRNISYGVRVVDKRAQLLDTTNLLEEASLDPYVFVRDAYLARRNSLVRDGNEGPRTDTQGGDATSPTSSGKPPEAKPAPR